MRYLGNIYIITQFCGESVEVMQFGHQWSNCLPRPPLAVPSRVADGLQKKIIIKKNNNKKKNNKKKK